MYYPTILTSLSRSLPIVSNCPIAPLERGRKTGTGTYEKEPELECFVNVHGCHATSFHSAVDVWSTSSALMIISIDETLNRSYQVPPIGVAQSLQKSL